MIVSARNNFDGTSGFELVNREIAFYGFGAVARAVHKLAQGFGMKSFAYDPYIPADKIKVSMVSFVWKNERFGMLGRMYHYSCFLGFLGTSQHLKHKKKNLKTMKHSEAIKPPNMFESYQDLGKKVIYLHETLTESQGITAEPSKLLQFAGDGCRTSGRCCRFV